MRKLEGKVAVITGASKGIGEGIAKVYAKYGAKLVLAARGARVLEFAEELRAAGYEAIGVRTDVTNKESVLNLVKQALDTYGTIDVLVNNAGVCVLGDLLSTSDEDRDYHIDININVIVPILVAGRKQVAQHTYTSVVHQNIDGSISIQCLLHQVEHTLFVRYVCTNADGLITGRTKLLCKLQHPRASGRQNQFGTVLGIHFGNPFSNSLGCTSDHSDFSFQLSHNGSSSFLLTTDSAGKSKRAPERLFTSAPGTIPCFYPC